MPTACFYIICILYITYNVKRGKNETDENEKQSG